MKNLDVFDVDFSLNPSSNLRFGIEVLTHTYSNFSPVLKNYWTEDVISNPVEWFKIAQEKAMENSLDFISLNLSGAEPACIEDASELFDYYKSILTKIQNELKMPLVLNLSSISSFDVQILNAIFPILKTPVVISSIVASNYKEIIKMSKKYDIEHKFILRTPIDINLTKELNILSIDAGLKPEQIIIDPDMGCVGYGLDYGYSIIERISLARGNDKMLDMPIIAFVGCESYKAKETKSEDFTGSWGDLNNRAIMWETTTGSALIASGANFIVNYHMEAAVALKKMYCEAKCQSV